MSGEHIWSEWIDRLLKPSRQSEFTFRRVAEDKTVLASWKSEKLNWKARVVCEPCNNGWMSDLENHHAKPTLSNILLGQPVSLPAKSIASLAAFTFKMTVVTDHMRSTRKPFFKPSVRSAFRRSLRVPSNVQMWLAAFHEPGSRNGLLRSYYVNVPNERYGDFQYLVVTWGIMPFMVQSVARRWIKPLVPKHTPVPHVTQNKFWNDGCPQFWPPRRQPISWPPPKYVGLDMIEQFVNRWTILREDR